MVAVIIIVLVALSYAVDASATIIYADNTLTASCTGGTYSIANRNCTGSDGNAYNTESGAVNAVQAGDTIYLRAGTWVNQWNFQDAGKTGTPDAWITMAGYPGERPVIKYKFVTLNGTPYGPIKAWCTCAYFLYKNFIIDGETSADTTSWYLRGGTHHITLEDIEMRGVRSTGLFITASNVTVRNVTIHDGVAHPTSRRYCIYVSGGSNILLENNECYNYPGGAFTIFANSGAITNLTIRNNRIHHNNTMNSPQAGIDVYKEAGATFSNIQVYDNLVYRNGLSSLHANPSGIRVSSEVNGVKVWNNTVYGNKGYGILLGSGSPGGPSINTVVQNNILTGNTIGALLDGGTATTKTFNACLSAESCGTSKITLSTATECFVDQSIDDYRLKQGTNVCRDAGTTVTTRPFAVGAPDLGAYEQGKVTSAVQSDGVDVIINTASGTIAPTTGITGFTVACVGCTGTPVVSSAALKAGSGSTIHLVLSGITASGTCTVSVGTTNITDGALIGGVAQAINSISALSVSGVCAASETLGAPTGAIAYYKLNEGSGVIASDETVNNYDAVVGTGVQWASVYNGYGLRFPAINGFSEMVVPFGASTNMGTASGATCAIVKVDTSVAQKVVFSSGSIGANQRLYFGVVTVGGVLQWGIGIQASGFGTGSEFIATSTLTSVCLTWGSGVATLWVNGVKGAQTDKSVKTHGAFVTGASNWVYGGDGTNSTNSGGYDVDEIVFWDTKPSDAVIQAYHTDRFIPGGAATCYAQAAHQIQHPHLYTGSTVVDYGLPSSAVDVVANGAGAAVIQINCVGSPGSPISILPYYSTSQGGTFTNIVPDSMGAGGISMYGFVTSALLNNGTVSGNISGALTNVPGATIYLSNTSQELLLNEDESKVIRYIFKFGDIENQVRCVALVQSGGTALAGGITPPEGVCFRIVPPAVLVP